MVVRYTENNFKIVDKARTNGGVTNSSVRVFEQIQNGINKVVSTPFVVDTNIVRYKLSLHQDVISKATNLKTTLTEVKWNNIVTVYENF